MNNHIIKSINPDRKELTDFFNKCFTEKEDKIIPEMSKSLSMVNIKSIVNSNKKVISYTLRDNNNQILCSILFAIGRPSSLKQTLYGFPLCFTFKVSGILSRLSLRQNTHIDKKKDLVRLLLIGTDPQNRYRGYGKKLLLYVINDLKQQGSFKFVAVMSSDPVSHYLFSNNGFSLLESVTEGKRTYHFLELVM